VRNTGRSRTPEHTVAIAEYGLLVLTLPEPWVELDRLHARFAGRFTRSQPR
jgi:hypothetical protein